MIVGLILTSTSDVFLRTTHIHTICSLLGMQVLIHTVVACLNEFIRRFFFAKELDVVRSC